MKILHTMIRVGDLQRSVDFYTTVMGMDLLRTSDRPEQKYKLAFVGLRGDAQATAEVAKEFKVIYQKRPGQTPGTYTMDHSAGTFIFDPNGKLRVYVGYGQGAEVFAHDIKALLKSQG